MQSSFPNPTLPRRGVLQAGGLAALAGGLAVGGQTYGPYTDEQMRAMLAAGQVAPTTSAWRPGAAGWAAVSTYAELGAGAAPPPPPPPPVGG